MCPSGDFWQDDECLLTPRKQSSLLILHFQSIGFPDLQPLHSSPPVIDMMLLLACPKSQNPVFFLSSEFSISTGLTCFELNYLSQIDCSHTAQASTNRPSSSLDPRQQLFRSESYISAKHRLESKESHSENTVSWVTDSRPISGQSTGT